MNNRRKVGTILIGTGQGGVPLAEKLAKDGQKVVVFERGPWGGCCLNYGCTPSKMLLASAHAANNAQAGKSWRYPNPSGSIICWPKDRRRGRSCS